MTRRSAHQNAPLKQVQTRTPGCLPVMRPHYPAHIASALAALAESRPDPATYAREKARILGGHE